MRLPRVARPGACRSGSARQARRTFPGSTPARPRNRDRLRIGHGIDHRRRTAVRRDTRCCKRTWSRQGAGRRGKVGRSPCTAAPSDNRARWCRRCGTCETRTPAAKLQSVLIEHPSAIAASGGASDPEQEIRTNSTNSIRPARPRRTKGGIMIAGESLSLPPFVNGDCGRAPDGYFTTEPTSCSTCSPADW